MNVAVLGGGIMGNGIAQVAASAGYSVSLYDVEERIAKQGLARIGANLDAGIARGKVPPEAKAEVLSRLAAVSHLETALDRADLVVEAVPERIDLKRNGFAQVEARVDDSTLLATNTSSLRVADSAGRLRRPGRLLERR